MITFLVALDLILAVFIIAGIFFHRGSDGFMGDAPSAIASNFRLETYDKIIGCFALAFFLVTLSINYLTLRNHKDTTEIDSMIQNVNLNKEIEKINTKDAEKTPDAPLAK